MNYYLHKCYQKTITMYVFLSCLFEYISEHFDYCGTDSGTDPQIFDCNTELPVLIAKKCK